MVLASELNVVKDEEFATNRQVIVPVSQQTVLDEIAAIHAEISANKFTGTVTVNYNQGGVTNMTTTHIHFAEGLFGEDEEEDEQEEDGEDEEEEIS